MEQGSSRTSNRVGALSERRITPETQWPSTHAARKCRTHNSSSVGHETYTRPEPSRAVLPSIRQVRLPPALITGAIPLPREMLTRHKVFSDIRFHDGPHVDTHVAALSVTNSNLLDLKLECSDEHNAVLDNPKASSEADSSVSSCTSSHPNCGYPSPRTSLQAFQAQGNYILLSGAMETGNHQEGRPAVAESLARASLDPEQTPKKSLNRGSQPTQLSSALHSAKDKAILVPRDGPDLDKSKPPSRPERRPNRKIRNGAQLKRAHYS